MSMELTKSKFFCEVPNLNIKEEVGNSGQLSSWQRTWRRKIKPEGLCGGSNFGLDINKSVLQFLSIVLPGE